MGTEAHSFVGAQVTGAEHSEATSSYRVNSLHRTGAA